MCYTTRSMACAWLNQQSSFNGNNNDIIYQPDNNRVTGCRNKN